MTVLRLSGRGMRHGVVVCQTWIHAPRVVVAHGVAVAGLILGMV